MAEYILVLTTVPDRTTGQDISQVLVEDRLAACVTISGTCLSSFWWKDKISQEEELILYIKTKATLYDKLEKRIKEIHPYDVPEIIAIPLIKGSTEYLNWIEEETKT